MRRSVKGALVSVLVARHAGATLAEVTVPHCYNLRIDKRLPIFADGIFDGIVVVVV